MNPENIAIIIPARYASTRLPAKPLIEIEGKPIYLETETEENVSLYKKFGFEILKKITLPELNLPMWEMIRYNN